MKDASVGGKYSDLKQVLKCPEDQRSYGSFYDYGYWGGGSWCGTTAVPGYWVWVYPHWYIWGNAAEPEMDKETLPSVQGKYSGLLQVLKCEKDRENYGSFRDYGYWTGTEWCGSRARAGYWVWVYPNWYIWEKKK